MERGLALGYAAVVFYLRARVKRRFWNSPKEILLPLALRLVPRVRLHPPRFDRHFMRVARLVPVLEHLGANTARHPLPHPAAVLVTPRHWRPGHILQPGRDSCLLLAHGF